MPKRGLIRLAGLGPLLCAMTLHAASLRYINVSFSGLAVRTVVLHETDNPLLGLLIDENELPPDVFEPEALAALPRYDGAGCAGCLRVADLGEYSEDAQTVSGTLLLRPQLLPRRIIDLRAGGGEVAAPEPGFGAFVNYSLNARYSEAIDDLAAVGLSELGFGLGWAGQLRSGFLFTDSDRPRRLQTTLTHFDVASRRQLAIGDVSLRAGPLGSGTAVGGVRWGRDFNVAPDSGLFATFDLAGTLSLPGTVALYVDGQQRLAEDVEAGEVEVRNLGPGYYGNEVELRITDIAGNEQVIRTRLGGATGLLPRGTSDFSVGAGLRRVNENTYDRSVASGIFRYGWHDYSTLEVQGEVAENGYGLASAGLTSSLPWLNLRLAYGGVVNDGHYGSAYFADVSQSFNWGGLVLSPFASALRADNYVPLNRVEPLQDLTRVGVAAGVRNVFAGASYNRAGTADSMSFDVGLTWRRVSTGASYIQFGNDSSLTLFRFSAQFGTVLQPLLSAVRSQADGGTGINQIGIFGFAPQHRLSAGANYTRSDDGRMTAAGASLSYAPEPWRLAMSVAETDGQTSAAVNAVGAIAMDGWRPHAVNPIGFYQGYAIADVGYKGVRTAMETATDTTGRDGRAVATVTAFRKHAVRIDRGDLPEGVTDTAGEHSVSVYPGQSQRTRFEYSAAGFFLVVQPAVPVGTQVFFNGRPFSYYEFGAYIDGGKLRPGLNEIRIEDQPFQIEMPEIGNGLPTLILDLRSGTLGRR